MLHSWSTCFAPAAILRIHHTPIRHALPIQPNAVAFQENQGQQTDLLSTVGQAVPIKHRGKQSVRVLPQQQDPAQEFKFTLAAARRTELRRLHNFVKMADYMMCDTLQQVASLSAVAAPVHHQPATDTKLMLLDDSHRLSNLSLKM